MLQIRKKLFTSSVTLLHLSSNIFPNLQTHRVFNHCFRPCNEARVVTLFPHHHFSDSRVSQTLLFSSKSDSRGGVSKCWNCEAVADADVPFLACGSCRSVQPVDHSVDYFKIFGLERVYVIRDGNLEGKYKDWQKKLHPDLVHTKSEQEKGFAAEQSARVIDAYRTLSNPLSRALYLLHLEGIEIDEEKTVTYPELLAEMMDIRETVEEASDSEELKQIQSQIQNKLDEWSNCFDEAFKKRDFDEAIAATQRMRYYERAIEETVKKS